MPSQTLEEEGLTLVFLGSFNPAIFHPQWFVRMRLISETDGREDSSNVKILSHEVCDVSFAGVQLQCLPERLTLTTANPARYEQLQELVINTLQILPHTPFQAAGINRQVHYRVQSEKYWHAIGHALLPKEPIWKPMFADPRTQSVSVKQERSGDFPGVINVTVEPSLRYHPGIYVRTNWHHALTAEQQAENSAAKIIAYLKAVWSDACSQAKTVAEGIFSNVSADD